MFGLPYLVVTAERELREKGVKSYEEARPAPWVWMWRHKLLLLVIGVLTLLLIGGSGA